MFVNITLPSGITYNALRFIDMPDGPMPYCIQFDTDHRVIDTNPQELSRALVHVTLSQDPEGIERRGRFLSLHNAFERPVPPPEMPGFVSRHLGSLAPDRYGHADASLFVPALSDKALQVWVDALGAADADALDAALDRFLGGLTGHLTMATPHVVQNMRAFCRAVYRDPD
ncbi:MAG: hypothetical protein AAFV87_19280, partial [Pseudomonadota bacterium]